MSSLHSTERPRIYLDINGVLVVDNSPFELVSLNCVDKYSPEVARRLGATGMDLVMLSTWGCDTVDLTGKVDALLGARVLMLANVGDYAKSITRKMHALIQDQESSPSPFVWVDDHITQRHRRRVEESLAVPKLIISPDIDFGINEMELANIEAFSRQYL